MGSGAIRDRDEMRSARRYSARVIRRACMERIERLHRVNGWKGEPARVGKKEGEFNLRRRCADRAIRSNRLNLRDAERTQVKHGEQDAGKKKGRGPSVTWEK